MRLLSNSRQLTCSSEVRCGSDRCAIFMKTQGTQSTQRKKQVNPYVRIIGDSPVEIWGLGGQARLTRMLESMDGVQLVTDQTPAPAGVPVLLIRGDYLFDRRLLQAMLQHDEDFALYNRACGAVVALRSGVDDPGVFDAAPEAELPPRIEPEALVNPYDDRLQKYEPARVWQIRADNREALERELFSSSYKGVTDLVTKWVWPLPARWATKFCAGLGIKPNHVTGLSLALAVLAGVAFWCGHFATGLALGWCMTFLDTVDGKLARVTLTSSRFGDLLDHCLDLIHPPLWYIAWGVGLGAAALPVELTPLVLLMLAGYIGGRLCEGAFQLWIAQFPIFLWQPVDSLSRLITARRNPNLLLLSASLLAGRPELGLLSIIVWHLLSTLFLLYRLGMAWKMKQERGPLQCWLAELSAGVSHNRLALKIFT